jgi:hypothetical protein
VNAQTNTTNNSEKVAGKPAHAHAKPAKKDEEPESNGVVLSHYHGVGPVDCDDCNRCDDRGVSTDVYCYQCRAFHKGTDYAYYNNRENCYELEHGHHHYVGVEGCADCGEHAAPIRYYDHYGVEGCRNCGDYEPDIYNMDHEYDHCGNGEYIVKYRGNKVKVKCTDCNAKWKYYYNDYHSNNHYVYDKNDKVIVSYED